MPQISIETIIKQAKAAQTEFESAGQEVVDELITGLAWSLLEPGTNRSLSNQAVHDTGLGNADDKFTKNYRKTLGLLRDLKNTPSVGVIKELPEKGLVEIARPVGVVGAVTPSTNPIATPLNNTLNAIKGRNSIILAPSPKGDAVCELIVEILQKVLVRLGHPEHLIQKISSPASKEATNKLMQSVDMVVVTGSEKNVSSAYRSGTPAIGVGVGNVAIDAARVLVKTPAEMAETDIAEHASIAVQKSPLTDVYMFGRRGPIEAKFTNVELREMGKLENCLPVIDPTQLPESVTGNWSDRDQRLKERNLATMREFLEVDPTNKDKKVHFEFFANPVEVLGNEKVDVLFFSALWPFPPRMMVVKAGVVRSLG